MKSLRALTWFCVLLIIVLGGVQNYASANSIDSVKKAMLIEKSINQELDKTRSNISYSGPGNIDPQVLSDENLKLMLSGQELVIEKNNWEFGIKKLLIVRQEYTIKHIYKLDRDQNIVSLTKEKLGPLKEETSWWATIVLGLVIIFFIGFLFTAAFHGEIKTPKRSHGR